MSNPLFPSQHIRPMQYKGYTYNIQGEPGHYCYQILKDDIQIEQPDDVFHGVVPANQAARLRIDELTAVNKHEPVNTELAPKPLPTPEPKQNLEEWVKDTPTPKRRGRPRKTEPTYTFTPQEDAELVQVEATEEGW